MLRKQPHSHEWNWFPVAEISETNLLHMNIFDVIDCHLFHFKGNPGCIISQQSEQQHTAFFWEGDGWWSGVAVHITEDKCPIQLFVLCIIPLVYDYMICNRSTHSMLSFISFVLFQIMIVLFQSGLVNGILRRVSSIYWCLFTPNLTLFVSESGFYRTAGGLKNIYI